MKIESYKNVRVNHKKVRKKEDFESEKANERI